MEIMSFAKMYAAGTNPTTNGSGATAQVAVYGRKGTWYREQSTEAATR